MGKPIFAVVLVSFSDAGGRRLVDDRPPIDIRSTSCSAEKQDNDLYTREACCAIFSGPSNMKTALLLALCALLVQAEVTSTITSLHNAERNSLTVNSLVWNTTVAAIAQKYSDKCNYAHSGTKGLGENIAASAASGSATAYSDADARSAVNMWIGEKPNWNCATNQCTSGKVCGHYTQVVWESSTQIGCGTTSCTTNSPFGSSFPNWKFTVCNYAPPGNYVGRRPFDASKCGGKATTSTQNGGTKVVTETYIATRTATAIN
ncbi:lipoprotein [Planoprotostelium fungivorum]|uniref:Lipoprotein n=1 Tax=Planoprotostelium fungivorum TaxID=1890364 RepID=A0A2P6NQS3_9EUKA|nr:lipoprotein [Planoprotostelium fungivorum]